MMLQSHDGVIRLFPDWPVDQDTRFGTLRTVGAFLVSVKIKNGVVGEVSILSEKGRECTIVNPWPGKQVRLARNGNPSETLDGKRCTFKTGPGETVALVLVDGAGCLAEYDKGLPCPGDSRDDISLERHLLLEYAKRCHGH
jgi:alpha-L-fucosidase 2